ncbi:sigma factor-like helix-turn-helix DNA-binding protein, partial [Klebsiella aerogenes]
ALHLVTIEGMAYAEAAAVLGIPIGTLMSRLGRGRAALRAFEEGHRPRGEEAEETKPRPGRPRLRLVADDETA